GGGGPGGSDGSGAASDAVGGGVPPDGTAAPEPSPARPSCPTPGTVRGRRDAVSCGDGDPPACSMHTEYAYRVTMAVREGLMALLVDEPRHGYQLKTAFEAATGGVWRLNVGQVYSTLDRLHRDGLVAVDDTG